VAPCWRLTTPRYVTAIDAESGTVQVGSAADLEIWRLTGQRPVFTAGVAPDRPLDCAVQVRAHGEAVDAQAQLLGEELSVRLRSPLRGVAPGQTLVLYRRDADGDEVLGSATIATAS
jgi:tRNA-specific 2-thiouridylase